MVSTVQVCLLTFGLAAVAFAFPSAKDLAADIATAERTIEYFDIEVTALSSSVYALETEFNFDVTNTANDILDELELLTVSNFVEIKGMMSSARTALNADFQQYEANLRLTRTLLLTINDNLEHDLTLLAANVVSLKAEVDSGNTIYSRAANTFDTSVADIEAAITLGIGDQEGEGVTRVWVGWTHIKDVLINEQFLVGNAKMVYDVRSQNAFTALDVVVGQLPPK